MSQRFKQRPVVNGYRIRKQLSQSRDKSWLLRGLAVLLTAAFILSLPFIIKSFSPLGGLKNGDELMSNGEPVDVPDTEDIDWEALDTPATLVIIGLDQENERNAEELLLLRLDFANREAIALVIPGKTYLTDSEFGPGPIGEARAGGPRRVVEAVNHLTGVAASSYVELFYSDFERAIDPSQVALVFEEDSIVSSNVPREQRAVYGTFLRSVDFTAVDIFPLPIKLILVESDVFYEPIAENGVDLLKSFHLPPDEPPDEPVETSEERVEVLILNGSGEEGIAARVGDLLREKGIVIANITNADHFGYEETRIVLGDPQNSETAAKIKEIIGTGVIAQEEHEEEADIIVIVGADYNR